MKHKYLITLIIFSCVILSSAWMDTGDDFQNMVIVTSKEDMGAGSLREALQNASSGTIIKFSPTEFPKKNPGTIMLFSELPGLRNDGITIDASDAGVILDGTECMDGMSGIKIHSSGNKIKGLEIIHFRDFGIIIEAGASKNIIGGEGRDEGNVIGWNDRNGIAIWGDENMILGNHIGIDRTGKTHLSNQEYGIYVADGASGNVIGGLFERGGNIVSGNGVGGIFLNRGVTDTKIQGNIIGLDASRKKNVGNSGFGIRIEESMNTLIGGADAAFGNDISGCVKSAIEIVGPSSSGNQVVGNTIGHNLFGYNNEHGVLIADGAHDNQIGPRNIIAFSGENGIMISGMDTERNTVTANQIFNNEGEAIVVDGQANQGILPPVITEAGSRYVTGNGVPGQLIEVFSDREEEAQYFECSAVIGADGKFECKLQQGAFREQMIKALATDDAGNTSNLSNTFQNPGLAVMKELPDLIAPSQVSRDPAVIGTNITLAVVSLAFFGFTTHLFNNMVETGTLDFAMIKNKLIPEKARIWVKQFKATALSSSAQRKWMFILFWLTVVLINAAMESFLDPTLHFFDAQRVHLIISLFFTGIIVSGIEWFSDWQVRRKFQKNVTLIGQIRWIGLVAALASVVFSRTVGFTPGYVMGTMGTIILLPDMRDIDKNGKRSLFLLSAIFGCGLFFWLFSQTISRTIPWLEPLCLNIFTICIQGVLFELLPFSVCEGKSIWQWKRGLWFLMFGVLAFIFLHTFLNPNAPDIQALQQNGVQILLVAMAVYGLATLFYWIKLNKNKHQVKGEMYR